MPALGVFWQAARGLDPSIAGETPRPGTQDGELRDLLLKAGLSDVHDSTVEAWADYDGFDDWWSAYTLGVGPIGSYYQSLDEAERQALREECRHLLGHPIGSFTLVATAWFACGTPSTVAGA
jgi:hypothetical protein